MWWSYFLMDLSPEGYESRSLSSSRGTFAKVDFNEGSSLKVSRGERRERRLQSTSQPSRSPTNAGCLIWPARAKEPDRNDLARVAP
jgi:hypothetical protein